MMTELAVALFIAAAAMTALLILLLRPLLVRYALARPIARSSHRIPTPQGGGIAVIAALSIAIAAAWLLLPGVFTQSWRLATVLAATIGLAIIGAADDIRPIQPLPRLALQSAAVLVVLAALPAGLRLLPLLPFWTERAVLAFGLLWFVNLTNFMDGLDWITVTEVVPITAAVALFGSLGGLPFEASLIAVALCGAMIGFAPFNKPVARLFLGDVGSLPVGLLLGWLLILLANEHLAAALLLPLYYLADATITLLKRLVRGEAVMEAHRSHFYQQAADGGMSPLQICARLFVLNCVLASFARLTFDVSAAAQLGLVACGAIAVTILLVDFARAGKRRSESSSAQS